MATLSAVVFKHQRKPDGTYPVKIRIAQFSKSSYLPTNLFANEIFVDRKYKLKHTYIRKEVASLLAKLNSYIPEAMSRDYEAYRIKGHLIEMQGKELEDSNPVSLNFIDFCKSYIKELEDDKRVNSAIPMRTVLNSLVDYTGNDLPPRRITSKWLKAYELYLRSERQMSRRDQFGRLATVTRAGLSDAGLFKHMANLRTMFNACCVRYNDYDTGKIVIPNQPFVRYKIKPTRVSKKRHLTIDELTKLYRCSAETDRESIAKDMFFLSFFLCGMNSVDIFNYIDRLSISAGRLEYRRSKTMHREDGAFISIAVPECTTEIWGKYSGKLARSYSSDRTFNKALNLGLRSLGERCGIDCTFYFARHTFATIARNDCGFSKDDVAAALNHVDQSTRITDRYIAKDWSKIDHVQSAVLHFFFDKLKE